MSSEIVIWWWLCLAAMAVIFWITGRREDACYALLSLVLGVWIFIRVISRIKRNKRGNDRPNRGGRDSRFRR